MPYFTSPAVTGRLTGAENRIPARRCTVTVRPSAEMSGSAAARSATGCVGSPGLKLSSVRCVARTIIEPLTV